MSTDIINSAAIYYYNTQALTVGVMGQGNNDVDKIGFGSGNSDESYNVSDHLASEAIMTFRSPGKGS